MENLSEAKTKEFLYTDENVKYSFKNEGQHITVHCDHPIFVRRFNNSSVTLSADDFFKTSQKGSEDYAFFSKTKNRYTRAFSKSRSIKAGWLLIDNLKDALKFFALRQR